MKYFSSLFLIICMITSCNFKFSSNLTLDDDAKKILDEYYNIIKNKKYNNIDKYLSDEYFKKSDKAEWIKMLKAINRKLGPLQNYEIKSQNTTNIAGTSGKTTTIQLILETKYKKYSAMENITLMKTLKDNHYKIAGHHINSKGLVLE